MFRSLCSVLNSLYCFWVFYGFALVVFFQTIFALVSNIYIHFYSYSHLFNWRFWLLMCYRFYRFPTCSRFGLVSMFLSGSVKLSARNEKLTQSQCSERAQHTQHRHTQANIDVTVFSNSYLLWTCLYEFVSRITIWNSPLCSLPSYSDRLVRTRYLYKAMMNIVQFHGRSLKAQYWLS